jgi:hypothetical protein
MTAPGISGPEGDVTLVVEQRFAIVPEWVIDAEISDSAFRLYSVLLRYGQSSGARMPSRATLARRLKKRSVDSVDRAMRELVAAGAVVVERRRRGRQNLTNRYHVITSAPGGRTPAATGADPAGGRAGSATPGRTGAAGVVAWLRPDPEHVTQEEPPPPVASSDLELCQLLGVEDFDAVAEACRSARRRLGLPTARWTSRALAVCLRRAVVEHGWPAPSAVPALLAVAADPQTRSPARLEHPGPWWDAAETAAAVGERLQARDELRELGAWLAETGGSRVSAQRRARAHLTSAGQPVTALAVARLASRYLGRPTGPVTADLMPVLKEGSAP